MPRYIVVTLGCDWENCTNEATEGDGTVAAVTVAIDNKQGKEFLLCKEHREQLDEILIPLMQKGVKVESAKPRSTTGKGAAAPASGDGNQAEPDLVCREEGCHRQLKNTTGLAQHAIRSHGYESLDDYRSSHGLAA